MSYAPVFAEPFKTALLKLPEVNEGQVLVSHSFGDEFSYVVPVSMRSPHKGDSD